ncbi:hypothetical protein LXL04_001729 [Taraxacum kok-saghyz]
MVYDSSQRTQAGKIDAHLLPHSHDDVGWLKTVDQYYTGANNSIRVPPTPFFSFFLCVHMCTDRWVIDFFLFAGNRLQGDFSFARWQESQSSTSLRLPEIPPSSVKKFPASSLRLHLPVCFFGKAISSLRLPEIPPSSMKNDLLDFDIVIRSCVTPFSGLLNFETALQKRRLEGTALEGPIPNSYAALTQLDDLRIGDLGGEDSTLDFLVNFTSISIRYLGSNDLNGVILRNIVTPQLRALNAVGTFVNGDDLLDGTISHLQEPSELRSKKGMILTGRSGRRTASGNRIGIVYRWQRTRSGGGQRQSLPAANSRGVGKPLFTFGKLYLPLHHKSFPAANSPKNENILRVAYVTQFASANFTYHTDQS